MVTIASAAASPASVALNPSASGNGEPRRLGRSIGAVTGGLAATFAVTTAVDVVMHATGIFPPMDAPPMSNALFALAFSYRCLIAVGGAALTARIAPRRPLLHATVFGCIGLAIGVAGAIVMRDAGPAWYGIAVAASALPCAVLGAKLARRG